MVGRSLRGQIGVIALVLFLSYLLSAFMYLKLVFLIATLLLLHYATRHAWLFAVAVSLTALAVLIRSPYGILSYLMLFSYSFYIAYVRREPKLLLALSLVYLQ
jgi:predicted membrane protein